jgi:UDP-N-acetylglucosamine 2-epimerase (non-hydrolysing)
MYDLLRQNIEIVKKSYVLKKFDIKPKEYFLATIHRPSNTDSLLNLSNILDAFSRTDEKIVFPIHPRTDSFIKKFGLAKKISRNIQMIKPVSYFDFVWLEKNAKKILTDSGGIQKEAYFLKVPCITLRENTEWIETIEDGWNILVGAHSERILDAMNNFNPKGKQKNHFGKGDASKKIVKILEEYKPRNFSKN